MDEPNTAGAGTNTDPDRVGEDVAAVTELAGAGVEVDGEAQVAELTKGES